MGGSSSKQTIREKISTELSLKIKNHTENINSIMNETLNNIEISTSQNSDANVDIGTRGSNELILRGAKIGGSVDNKQIMSIDAQSNAVIRIVSDQSALNDFANKVNSEILSKVDKDNNMNQALEAINKISETTKKNGGPEGIIDSLASMAQETITSVLSIGGSRKESDVEKEVRTKLEQEFENTVINRTEIKKKISNTIKQTLNQLTKANCKINTSGSNLVDATGAQIGGDLKNVQAMNVKSFQQCMIDLNMGNKIVNSLMEGIEFKSSNTSSDKVTSSQQANVENTIDKTTIQESSIMKTIDNLINMVGSFFSFPVNIIGGIVVACVLLIIIFMFMGSSGQNGGNQNGGGLLDCSNGHIILGIIIIIGFLKRKSVPACGVLLSLLIGYYVYVNRNRK